MTKFPWSVHNTIHYYKEIDIKCQRKRFTSISRHVIGLKVDWERSTHVDRVKFHKVPTEAILFYKVFARITEGAFRMERSQNSRRTSNAILNI